MPNQPKFVKYSYLVFESMAPDQGMVKSKKRHSDLDFKKDKILKMKLTLRGGEGKDGVDLRGKIFSFLLLLLNCSYNHTNMKFYDAVF